MPALAQQMIAFWDEPLEPPMARGVYVNIAKLVNKMLKW